jgi:hypothetical protein
MNLCTKILNCGLGNADGCLEFVDFGGSDVEFVDEVGVGVVEVLHLDGELSDLFLEVFDVGVGHCETGF